MWGRPAWGDRLASPALPELRPFVLTPTPTQELWIAVPEEEGTINMHERRHAPCTHSCVDSDSKAHLHFKTPSLKLHLQLLCHLQKYATFIYS